MKTPNLFPACGKDNDKFQISLKIIEAENQVDKPILRKMKRIPKIILFLFFVPAFLFSQSFKVTNDSITIIIKLKITEKKKFLKDSMYQCGPVKIRTRKDSLYYYDDNQYLKIIK